MTAVQEVYQGAGGCVINYPPPGKLGEDGKHYSNPFLTLETETEPIQKIYRSFGVCFYYEEARNTITLETIPEVDETIHLEVPLLTRQENNLSDSSDSDNFEYICLRCPEHGICLSCGLSADK